MDFRKKLIAAALACWLAMAGAGAPGCALDRSADTNERGDGIVAEEAGIGAVPEEKGGKARLFGNDNGVSMQTADFPEEYRTGVTLVYFTKPGCPACAKQDPVYEEVVRNLPSPARAYQIYEHMVNLENYKVTELPTLVVFRDGKECRRFTGVTSGKKLLSAVHSAL